MALDLDAGACHGGEQGIVLDQRLVRIDHADFDARAFEGCDAILGKARRRHALGLGAAQVARQTQAGLCGFHPGRVFGGEPTTQHAEANAGDRLDRGAQRFACFERFPQAADRAQRGHARRVCVARVGRRRRHDDERLMRASITRAQHTLLRGFGIATHIIMVARHRPRGSQHHATARRTRHRDQRQRTGCLGVDRARCGKGLHEQLVIDSSEIMRHHYEAIVGVLLGQSRVKLGNSVQAGHASVPCKREVQEDRRLG